MSSQSTKVGRVAPRLQRWTAITAIALFLCMIALNISFNRPKQIYSQNHQHQVSLLRKRNQSLDIAEKTWTANGKLVQHYRVKNVQILADKSAILESVLVMVVYNNRDSWGHGRSLEDFVKLVKSFDYPLHKISLGILTSSQEEYDVLKKTFARELETLMPTFSQVSITQRQDFSVPVDRGARKGDDIQKERRRMLARYRNYALFQSLESWHDHVVWIDSDVVKIPTYLVSKMVASGKDILEPICYVENTDREYDLNAWAGMRRVPTPEELERMHEGELFVPRDVGDTVHLAGVRDDYEYYPLDSVGGTMLYVKADIHRQGVLFTPHYIIGSEWKYEGYDGIETEGLCYVAGMIGYKCYGMPQDPIFHADS